MFEIRLAERPFRYKDVDFSNPYEYFLLTIDGTVSGYLRFDLDRATLTEVVVDDMMYYDVLLRSAFNHFERHGYPSLSLEGEDFLPFLAQYETHEALRGNEVELSVFFAQGCSGCK